MTAAFEIVCPSTEREAWLEARRAGIGSSDAPSILGVSPFRSALSVYAEKVGLYVDDEESEAMKWGKILEPHILREFGEETMRAVWPAGQLIRSARIPWMLATLDGEQRAPGRAQVGTVEAKATGWRVGDWSEGIPLHVFAQAQHQLEVSGRDWGTVVVLQNGCRLFWKDIEKDLAFVADVLLPAEADFWQRVQNREPVDPDGSASAAEALAKLYPKSNGQVIHLPGHMVELDEELEFVKEEAKRCTKRAEEIAQTLKAAIGEAEIGFLANGISYTHKLQKRAGYTVKDTEFRALRRFVPSGRQ